MYLDDVIVFSPDFDAHLKHLNAVFGCISDAGLKLKPSKCMFRREKVDYLGHVVSAKGVSVQPQKVKAVTEFPLPTTVTQLRSFLSLAGYYRRFIPPFSLISSPLNELLKKGQQFVWTDKCQEGFETLKARLTSAPILAFPLLDRPFRLATDASRFCRS